VRVVPSSDPDGERRQDGDADDVYVEQLEQYRRRLDGAMFAGDLAWWEMDVETGAVHFHENKADLLGMSPADFEHYEDFTELVHPEDHERAMQAMRDHLEGRAEKYDAEYRIRAASGEYRWFHDVGGITERDADGSPAKVTGVVVDVTRRKETEERLRRKNEQLTLLNRIVRHDIRNDMNVVTGWAEALVADATSEEGEAIERILGASQHTIELTEDVGDLMELLEDESDGVELYPVDLGRVVEGELERVDRSFENVELRIEGEIPSVRVEANGMLSSVVGNLLNNAVQHNDGETARIDVGIDVREGTVVLRIADDGPGIPEERREEVFHRNAKGLDSEGTGVGLYLVTTLVGAYGGEVRIADNEPRGTVFSVELVRATTD
jgi:PAS domain S-box-containing protein